MLENLSSCVVLLFAVEVSSLAATVTFDFWKVIGVFLHDGLHVSPWLDHVLDVGFMDIVEVFLGNVVPGFYDLIIFAPQNQNWGIFKVL